MNIVACDSCNKEFIMNVIEEDIGNKTIKIYFICPHCNQEYLSYYTDILIRKKQKRMRDIVGKQEIARGKKDIEQSEKLFKQYQRLKKELTKDMEVLKERVERVSEE